MYCTSRNPYQTSPRRVRRIRRACRIQALKKILLTVGIFLAQFAVVIVAFLLMLLIPLTFA